MTSIWMWRLITAAVLCGSVLGQTSNSDRLIALVQSAINSATSNTQSPGSGLALSALGGSLNPETFNTGSNNAPRMSLTQNSMNAGLSQQNPLSSRSRSSNVFSSLTSGSLNVRGLNSGSSGGQSIPGVTLTESDLTALRQVARSSTGNQRSALLVGPDSQRRFYLAQETGLGPNHLEGEQILLLGDGVVALTGQKVKITDLKTITPIPGGSTDSTSSQRGSLSQALQRGTASGPGSAGQSDQATLRQIILNELGSRSSTPFGQNSPSSAEPRNVLNSLVQRQNELGRQSQQSLAQGSGLTTGSGSLGRALTPPSTLGFGNSALLNRIQNIINAASQPQSTSRAGLGQSTSSTNPSSTGSAPGIDQNLLRDFLSLQSARQQTNQNLQGLGAENVARQQNLIGNQLDPQGLENIARQTLMNNPDLQLLQLSLPPEQSGGGPGGLQNQGSSLLQNQGSSPLLQGLQNQGSPPLQGLQNQGSSLLQGIQNRGSSLLQGLQNQGSSQMQDLQNQGSSLLQSLQNQGSSLLQGIQNRGSSLLQGLQNQGLQNQGSSQMQDLQNQGSSLLPGLQNQGSSQQQGLQNQASQGQGGLGNADLNTLLSILGQAQSGMPRREGLGAENLARQQSPIGNQNQQASNPGFDVQTFLSNIQDSLNSGSNSPGRIP